MDQNAKKIGLINWVVLLAAAVGLLLVSNYVNSAAAKLGAIIAQLGFMVAIMSYVQMRLEEREHFEKLELEEMSRSRGGESLFTKAADDTFPARRSREQFEKYIVPAFTVFLFFVQCAAVYWPWKLLGKMDPLKTDRATLAIAFVGLFFIVLFLLGKYSSGLARLQGQRLLRAGSSYGLLSAYACALIAIGIGAVVGFPKLDLIVGRALCVVVGLIALETLLSLIMEIYRVRVKGREARVLYESRLVATLGKPEAIFTTAAHALDYQFGFKISETWFFRFVERSFPILVAAQLGVLLLFSCLVFIEPGEQGLLERLGKPVAGKEVLNPGLHFKLPWPIDMVQRYQTDRVQTFIVGTETEEEDEKVIMWSKAHSKEDNLLVASRERPTTGTNETSEIKSPPVNLLAVGIPVQFQITNLLEWAYVNNQPDELLKRAALREVVLYLASADLEELMVKKRTEAGEVLRERIQAAATAHHLGAKIIFAGVADIHPPVKVANEYEKVIAASQSKEATILRATASAVMTNANARAEAFKLKRTAEADRERQIVTSAAQAAVFTNQMAAFQAAPAIYRERVSLELLGREVANSRKYVIGVTNTPSDIIQLNLEDKMYSGSSGMNLPTATKK